MLPVVSFICALCSFVLVSLGWHACWDRDSFFGCFLYLLHPMLYPYTCIIFSCVHNMCIFKVFKLFFNMLFVKRLEVIFILGAIISVLLLLLLLLYVKFGAIS